MCSVFDDLRGNNYSKGDCAKSFAIERLDYLKVIMSISILNYIMMGDCRYEVAMYMGVSDRQGGSNEWQSVPGRVWI
jgi:hypothetical protein